MKRFVYLNLLFDLYGELLTLKQQKYFTDYYFNNLSYGEISAKYGITRNAIYHQLKIIEKKLEFYEEKLKLYRKKEKINDIIGIVNNSKAKEELEKLF